MFVQLALGFALIVLSTLVAGAGYIVLERTLNRIQPWLTRAPHGPKLMLVLCASIVWIVTIVTAGVWIWAVALRLIGLFGTMEAAVYFALVAFTTLGFGDVLLPPEWRLLSGMTAVNGLLMIGLLTAMLVEVLRRVRNTQTEGRGWTT